VCGYECVSDCPASCSKDEGKDKVKTEAKIMVKIKDKEEGRMNLMREKEDKSAREEEREIGMERENQ
jgi:hypothetical protein